jgi:hypothetical protein
MKVIAIAMAKGKIPPSAQAMKEFATYGQSVKSFYPKS